MKLHFIIFATICLFQSLTSKADTTDNYQIYIKEVLVRNDSGFPNTQKNKTYIKLDKTLCGESIELHFHHCMGYQGKRKVLLTDKQNIVLKEFEFETPGYDAEMNIPVSFFCESSLVKSGVSYSLIYFDNLIKKGRHLTDIQIKR